MKLRDFRLEHFESPTMAEIEVEIDHLFRADNCTDPCCACHNFGGDPGDGHEPHFYGYLPFGALSVWDLQVAGLV